MIRILGPMVMTVIVVVCTAWAAPQALTKEDSMKTMQLNWKRSLATIALLAAFNGSEATVAVAQSDKLAAAAAPAPEVAPATPAAPAAPADSGEQSEVGEVFHKRYGLDAQGVPPPAGLVSWWRAEGDARDAAGGNHGTLGNGVAFVPGKVGQAFSFDGDYHQYVRIPYSPTLIASNYTVAAWVKPSTQVRDPINQNVIFGQNYGAVQLVARTGATGVRIVFQFGTGKYTFYEVASETEIPIGQFTHLAGTWDGTTLRLYINGTLDAESSPGAAPVDSECDFFIGGFSTVGAGYCDYEGQFFNGLIDEAAFYRRALSAAEVQASYKAGNAGKRRPNVAAAGSRAPAGRRARVPPPPGLVSWWPGEGEGSDIIGHNPGTLRSGATCVPGKVGLAFDLDGASQYVDVPDSPSLNPTQCITVEAWIYPRLPLDRVAAPIIKKAGGGGTWRQDNGYALELAGTDAVKFWVYLNEGQGWTGTDSAPLPANQWSHVAGVYDGACVSFYLNGKLVGTPLAASGRIVPSRNPLQIGHDPSNPERYFHGLIDEASVYNTALTAEQIRAIYKAGSAGKRWPEGRPAGVPPPGLVSWWRAENNALDEVGGNDGTPYNGAGFAPGRVGRAFIFNGRNSYFEVPDSPSLRLTSELTIEFWVKRQSLQADDYIVNKGGDYTRGAQNYGVAITRPQHDGTLAFTFAGGNRHSIGITDLNWHHVAVVVRNGDVDPLFYVDGRQQPVTLREGAPTINLYPSTEPLHIGAQFDPISGWNYYSKALVDELSIYNRALAAAEIRAIYKAGSAGKCQPAR